MTTINKRSLKRKQSGFILPLLLAIIASFIAGFIARPYIPVSFLNRTNESLKLPTQISDKKQVSLPKDLVKISGCIPFEGEHWVRPADIPHGPFYAIHNGKVMAIEYMFEPNEIPGENYAKMPYPEFLSHMQKNKLELKDVVNELQTLDFDMPQADYTYMDLHWTAPHAGAVHPHFDLHMYLAPREEMKNICPESTIQEVLPETLIKDLIDSGVPLPQ